MLKHFIKIVLNRPSGALISGNDKDLPTGLFLWVVFVLLGLWLVIGYLHIQIINKREPLFIHIKKRLRGYIICDLCRFKPLFNTSYLRSFSSNFIASVLLPVMERIEKAILTIWSAVLSKENKTEYTLFDTSAG